MIKKEFINPWKLGNGAKLMEWSWIGNHLTNALMNKYLTGEWVGDTVVVIGDYAEQDYEHENYSDTLNKIRKRFKLDGRVDENGYEYSLFNYVYEKFKDISSEVDTSYHPEARYIFNTKLKEYIDLKECPLNMENKEKGWSFTIHPLSLLLAMGNGRGGGDYYRKANNADLIGSWVSSSKYIEVSDKLIFNDCVEFYPDFTEDNRYLVYREECDY